MKPLQFHRHWWTILAALWEAEAAGKPPPCLRELATLCGCQHANIRAHLLRMRGADLVTWEIGHAKTLRATVRLELCEPEFSRREDG